MRSQAIDTQTTFTGKQDTPDTLTIERLTFPSADDAPVAATHTSQREPYLATPALRQAVNVAIALGRPLLLQGEPGCGKTRLAYAVAHELGLPLETCYIKSTSQAQDLLYTYDALNRLYDAQLGADGPQDDHGAPRSRRAANYVALGPLGRAIARAQHGQRSVVLIDEIDKADLDFPNDLLYELDRLSFTVDVAPDLAWSVPAERPELRPIVFVTHNEEKALPSAFLRRCIYHYVEFPDDEQTLLDILALHTPNLPPAFGREAIAVLTRLRQIDLNKVPGLSELIDWVGYLRAVETPAAELDSLPYIGTLLKQHADQQRAQQEYKPAA